MPTIPQDLVFVCKVGVLFWVFSIKSLSQMHSIVLNSEMLLLARVVALIAVEILVLGNRIFFLAKKNDQRKFLFWLEKNGLPKQDWNEEQEIAPKH